MKASRFNFRAWDWQNQRMVYSVDTVVSRTNIISMVQFGNQVGYIEANGTSTWCPGHILMQSTCLVDKNGKEIFENDILRESDGSISLIVYGYAGFNIRAISGRCLSTRNLEEALSYCGNEGTPENSVVIGNKYENGDLLK